MTPEGATAPADPELRRLLWRCRRGLKELDLLLERFARAQLPGAPGALRGCFARLLELPDPLLAQYLLGGEDPGEPQMAQLVGAIRAYVA
ncbi:MAG TPA: succinate dehydrogenase assembly factor 2 [Steroidobacteraceae bacterium]|nr:succinate dehydrogenase assembly factor 2 [Steroidobacteraceae bacterium]